MRQVLLPLVFAACSRNSPIEYSSCPANGTVVSIVAGGEHFYGTATIAAQQDIGGSGTLTIVVCGDAGNDDHWRLRVFASSNLAPDASTAPPLPLTSTTELDIPSPYVTVSLQSSLQDPPSQQVISAQISASAGHMHGAVAALDAGVATFDGTYTFSCATNQPDPKFLTTFCKPFEPLAPP